MTLLEDGRGRRAGEGHKLKLGARGSQTKGRRART